MRNGKVKDITSNFVAGILNQSYSGCNVSIRNGVFHSYEMPLAYRVGGVIVMRPYEDCPSMTTKRHWNGLYRLANMSTINVTIRDDWSMKVS